MMWLYPRLREIPPEAWKPMLTKARATDFDTVEWAGFVAGVAFVAWLLDVEPSVLAVQSPFLVYLLQFVLAFPLLVAVVGPIYLRRTRRGLDRELDRGNIETKKANAHSDRKEA